MSEVTEKSTIGEGREWLRERLREGADCPLCTQRAQTYRRKITASQIRTAGLVFREQKRHGEDHWVHLPDIPQHSRDFATLAYFTLAKQKPGKRPDGGAPGYWRITEEGEKFLRGEWQVPKYALVFDGRRIGWDGDLIDIKEIAPEFNFAELMAGE